MNGLRTVLFWNIVESREIIPINTLIVSRNVSRCVMGILMSQIDRMLFSIKERE